jgi:hypothetical protein
MKIAIMQPYFFPYIGYFSLVSAVDKFVFYDDVDFIKNGWINRNRLFLSGDVRYITIPLMGAGSNIKINEVRMQPKSFWKRKFLASIEQSYSKAPNFKLTFDLIVDVLDSEDEKISPLAKNSIKKISESLSLGAEFIETSCFYDNNNLSGRDRVLDICRLEGASEYVNLPGGAGLYQKDQFSKHNLELEFIENKFKPYSQMKSEFTPGLSIIDVLMFNGFDEAREIIVGGSND